MAHNQNYSVNYMNDPCEDENSYEVEFILHRANVSYGVSEQWPGILCKMEDGKAFMGMPDWPRLILNHPKLAKKHGNYGDRGMYLFIKSLLIKGKVPCVIEWTDAIDSEPIHANEN